MSQVILEYDPNSPSSIEAYAKKLIGKSFADVCNEDTVNAVVAINDGYEEAHGDRKRKGGLGDLIEERFFHYECNNDSRPDFPDAGVELKVTPYKTNKNGSLTAKERLIITELQTSEKDMPINFLAYASIDLGLDLSYSK